MLRFFFVCICVAFLLPSCTEVVASHPPLQTATPMLKITSAGESTSLQMTKLNVDVSITGNIATTTFDIQFYNPADRVLEGEFEFPLSDGQNIVRYALDINGSLREGVVVEKAKARAAMENTIRRKIDPGLVEQTKGNNFRTRIYPIPAKGYKRILIATEQPLTSVDQGLAYQLPLLSSQPLQQFVLNVKVYHSDDKPSLPNNSLPHFSFNKDEQGWLANYTASNTTLANTIECIVPEKADAVYTETFEDHTYFYVHTKLAAQYQMKPKPSSIALLWDISASAEKRNRQKEMDLVKAYCKRLGEVTIDLIPFHITALPPEKFTIRNGDATALLKRMAIDELDGGTQLGAIDLHRYEEDEVLLFTDGLSTFGKGEIQLATTPVTLVNSSPNADYAYLKWMALQTHGRFIDLNTMAIDAALNEAYQQPLQFINATYNTNEVKELYAQTSTALQNGFSVAGILQKGPTKVTFNFGFGNKITSSKTIEIKDDKVPAGNVKRLWASAKIAQLDLEYEKNKEVITQLGKQFSIVTRNTSLLVLDRVEDYVQYEITPPAELQQEYFALLKETQRAKTDDRAIAFTEAADAMKEMKDWYSRQKLASSNLKEGGTDYDIITQPAQGSTSTAMNYNYTTTDSVVRYEESARPAPQMEIAKFTSPTIVADEAVKSGAEPETESLDLAQIGTINQEGVKDERRLSSIGYDKVPESAYKTRFNQKSSIELKEWNSDAVYLAVLQKTPVAQYRQKYLVLKKEYATQPSFFVDVARFFYAANNKPLALQALSNIAEMKLENPELLRIVSNQLIEFGEKELAVDVLREVLKIREEEPQSYRDLALALNETGHYQEAVDLLYKVVLGTWDSRFGSVKSIVLNEMNAIISAHAAALNLSNIDTQFIHPMPMDVRIVIGWSANDCDVDLWVTDPTKEKCYYEHNTTRAGGRISSDVTQGYGPEEFCIKKATTGNYLVDVNLFGDSRQTLGGPITIKAELFTNFGKPNQQRKVINCRVTTNKEVVHIGALRFGR